MFDCWIVQQVSHVRVLSLGCEWKRDSSDEDGPGPIERAVHYRPVSTTVMNTPTTLCTAVKLIDMSGTCSTHPKCKHYSVVKSSELCR